MQNGIRQGYWALYNAAVDLKSGPLDPEELPMMASPPHIRHCIDLIRQSLMCQPDLTVEVKNVSLGGVTGFGTTHLCRSWDQLVEWTSRWETFNHTAEEDSNSTNEHIHGS